MDITYQKPEGTTLITFDRRQCGGGHTSYDFGHVSNNLFEKTKEIKNLISRLSLIKNKIISFENDLLEISEETQFARKYCILI